MVTEIDNDQLLRVASQLTELKGCGLMGSKWQSCEAETIANQIICSCAYCLKTYGEACSWATENALNGVGGFGLVDNPKGVRLLGGDIICDKYTGTRVPSEPDEIAKKGGKFLVFRCTPQLLEYVEEFINRKNR